MNRLSVSLFISVALVFQTSSLVLTKESQSGQTRMSGNSANTSQTLNKPFVYKALVVSQNISVSDIKSIDSDKEVVYRKRLALIVNETNGCHVLDGNCSCYPLDNGLLLDCKLSSFSQMKDELRPMISQPIKSLTVNTMNESLDAMPVKLFTNFSTIEQMYISMSSLVNVSIESFEGLESSLKTLSLVNSQLKCIPKTALSIVKSLTALDLGNNQIEEVEAYAFYGLPLVSLNLQSNKINSLLEFSLRGLENTLVELVLSNNLIDRLPFEAIRRLKALVSLKLQSNQITELADDGSTQLLSLTSLDLHSNRIRRLDSHSFQTTPKLVSLSVANNRLTHLTDSSIFGHLLDLETLDLSFNELTAIELNNMKALRSIDLSNNELKSMVLSNLIGVREVFVSHNKLEKLTNKTFVNCSSLSVLFMQHNAIHTIQMNTFDALQHLLTLDLSFNQLKAIDSQLFRYNSQIQSLYIDNNPFHCDCRLLSIYEWLETHSRLLALDDRQDMLCSEPHSLKDSSLLSLSVGDFCPVPIISVMKISKLDSTQVSIKWEVHNDTFVDGFTLEHYSNLANNITPMALKLLGRSQRQLDIRDLMPENWYMFCVQANAKYHTHDSFKPMLINVNHLNASQYFAANRKCSQVRTLSKRDVITLSTTQIIASVVVLVVFILMITLCVLVVVYKYRSVRRRPVKSEVVADPEEFITYRHFSLPSSQTVYE